MSHLYRKSALEKLSSPEQLDQMVVITPMSVWLAVLAGLALVIAVAAWGLGGSVPVLMSCQGVYFDMGEVRGVYSDVEGIVKECRPDTGSVVKEGNILFVIEDEEGVLHRIRSSFDGAAYDVFVREGSYVSLGTELMQLRLENPSETGYVYCYVPLSEARQLEVGMEVMICPTYLNTKEYGHMVGEITEVSQFIVNRGDLEEQLGSSELIDTLLSGESLISVKCEIEKDDSAASGYRWSNEKGKTLEITNGTRVDVDVIISREAPVDLLF